MPAIIVCMLPYQIDPPGGKIHMDRISLSIDFQKFVHQLLSHNSLPQKFLKTVSRRTVKIRQAYR